MRTVLAERSPAPGVRLRLTQLAVVATCIAVLSACGDSGLLRDTTAPSSGPEPTAPTSSAPPSTTVVPTTTTTVPRQITMAFTGDAMAHDAVTTSGRHHGEAVGLPYDFTPMWHLIAPVVSRADLAVCHLETTITLDGAPPTGYPRFRAPFEYVSAISDAGYDACSTASNHSYDYGTPGVEQTIDALEQAGLGWAGTARTAEEGAGASVYTAGEVQVAHLSATYGLNGLHLPADQPWLADLIDVPRMLADAEAARAAGADLVVVSLHCCAEYRVEPSAPQVELVHELLASPDIDLVVGHHAHVVQPIERIGDKWAVYGLGNILSNMYESQCCPAASQDGVIVEIEFTEGADGRFTASRIAYTPTWVDRAGGHIVTPVLQALTDPALDPDRRAVLEASLDRTVSAIESRGASEYGLVAGDLGG